jgi:general secretion pathway protein L
MSELWKTRTAKEGRIGALLRWWRAELSALLPGGLALVLGVAHEILLLIPEGEDFRVCVFRHGRLQPVGLLSQSSVHTQLTQRQMAGAECVLRIPPELGLRRQAPLAVSALSKGFEAVSGEIERQTPFAPDQVYLGYEVEDRPDARGRVMANLALVPCETANALLGNLANAGITPERITLAQDRAETPGDTVHILKARRKTPPPKLLLVGVAVLAVLALVSPYARNAMILSSLRTELALAERQAAGDAAKRRAKQDAGAQLNELAEKRGGRPPVIALLDAVSRTLPDTAHLAQFELSRQGLTLQGIARSASELIAPLEALPFAARVEFSAPVLRDPASGLEQFQLSLTLSAASTASGAEK